MTFGTLKKRSSAKGAFFKAASRLIMLRISSLRRIFTVGGHVQQGLDTCCIKPFNLSIKQIILPRSALMDSFSSSVNSSLLSSANFITNSSDTSM